MTRIEWTKHIGCRLLLTDTITHIARNEWTLLEVSPNRKVGKFRNELNPAQFWTDLDEVEVLDVLGEPSFGPKGIIPT